MTMLRNKQWIILFVFAAFFTTLALSSVTEAAGKLTDLREAAWAEQAITEMHASSIIEGYPNGEFKPYNKVTRLEALAMLIRVLGLEEQAKALDKAKVDYQMPQNLHWGRGYLIMGVQKGMLNKDYLHLLQPGEPASRVEVTVLTYHALKLKPDNSELTFADTNQIPKDYLECVAAVVKNNIMQGLPGNVFKPNDNINRAQMAVLVSRLVENKFANPYPERRLYGKLESINKNNRVLSIKIIKQGSVNKTYIADCPVFLEGKKVDMSALKAGQDLCLVLNKSGQVACVKSHKEKVAQIYQGRVKNVFSVGGEQWLAITGFDGLDITRTVEPGVRIKRSDTTLDVLSLNNGDFVEIQIVDNKIVQINILSPSTVRGKVTAVSASSLTVWESSGDSVRLDVPAGVTVSRGSTWLTYAEVREGSQVEVTAYGQKALKIEVLRAPSREGVVRELGTGSIYWLTIRNDDGEIIEFAVERDVEVRQSGARKYYEDLRAGDRVRLELNSRERVIYIEILDNTTTVAGRVTELVTSGNPVIRIERSDTGRTSQYYILSSATYTRDGESIYLNQIVIGGEVEIRLENSSVKRITVTNDKNISLQGIVTYISKGSKRIWLEQVSGNEFSYYLADNVRLLDHNGNNISLEDVRGDWEVTLELVNGKVYRLVRQ